MIQVPTAFVILGVLGKKFAVIARKTNAVTVTDFLRVRYQSPAVVIGASIALVLLLYGTDDVSVSGRCHPVPVSNRPVVYLRTDIVWRGGHRIHQLRRFQGGSDYRHDPGHNHGLGGFIIMITIIKREAELTASSAS